MTKEEDRYLAIGKALKEADQSQLFGKPCFKIKGKAFVCFFQNAMVFKLNDKIHREALALDGAILFDPSGKKRPMKEWVQVPFQYANHWEVFAKAAYNYVKANA